MSSHRRGAERDLRDVRDVRDVRLCVWTANTVNAHSDHTLRHPDSNRYFYLLASR